jgi:predicted ArsR family transcriptional regulator
MDVRWRREKTDAVDKAAALSDPLRRRLFDHVVAAGAPVGRDDAAAAVGVSRSLAAYHLDQLAEQELLTVTYARRTRRSGPGAGRPAKLYAPNLVEVTVQIPARDDTLLADLLATAVESDATGAARDALVTATRAAGTRLGHEVRGGDTGSLVACLEERGYAPEVHHEGIRLRNCPFHHLVEDHLDLVCSLNHDLLGAAVDAAGVDAVAELDPQPGNCCVVLRPRRPPSE